MRKTRIKTGKYHFDRRLLFAAVVLLGFGLATINCSGLSAELPLFFQTGAESPAGEGGAEFRKDREIKNPGEEEEGEYLAAGMFWADLYDPSDVPEQPTPAHTPTDYMSLDVRDANLLDVLSLIAYKLDGNIIFLEEPSKITIKTSRLSPVTTLQTVLQKEGLDYLTIGRNYIVGQRGRLYEDFANRMYLSRFNLFYVSPQAMEGFIQDFNVPVESLSVDSNQHALWMQGTPMALGKAREIINSLDVMSNAAFGEGGSRRIRMPVAIATGNRAQAELRALVDFLSILLDGFRDDRTDLGWGTWDHPGPVPRIFMDWSSPVIQPHDIKMKVTPDLDPAPARYLHYLVAEGTPANIEIVTQMIERIRGTPDLPFRFEADPVNAPPDNRFNDRNDENADEAENEADGEEDSGDSDEQGQGGEQTTQQQSYTPPQAYYVGLNAVPPAGGRLSGAGAYISGSAVTVSAVTSDGYRFVRWIEQGAEVSTSPSYTFYLYGNRTLEAVFTRVTPVESTGGTGEGDPTEAESEESAASDPEDSSEPGDDVSGEEVNEYGEAEDNPEDSEKNTD